MSSRRARSGWICTCGSGTMVPLSRRVWVPLWYCVISRPVVSTYGYFASGVSAGARCSTRWNRARPSGVAKRSVNIRGVPG